MQKPLLMVMVASLAACGTVPTTPVKFSDLQSRESQLGFFTYSDTPVLHYVEYQGTSGNTYEQLEQFLRQRAEALCKADPVPYEVGHGVWAGMSLSWGLTPVMRPAPNPMMLLLPTPTGHSATFPKVSARIECKAPPVLPDGAAEKQGQ